MTSQLVIWFIVLQMLWNLSSMSDAIEKLAINANCYLINIKHQKSGQSFEVFWKPEDSYSKLCVVQECQNWRREIAAQREAQV